MYNIYIKCRLLDSLLIIIAIYCIFIQIYIDNIYLFL
jgi:hypothetical protein